MIEVIKTTNVCKKAPDKFLTKEKWWKLRDSLVDWKDLPPAKRGGTYKYPDKINALYQLAKRYKPKVIIETGFLSGHSACTMLNGSPDSTLYTFDVCRYNEHKAHEVLSKHFDIHLIEGDSMKTLPKWLEQKINFQFAFIDGNHEAPFVKSDVGRAMAHIDVGGIIIVDDVRIGHIKNTAKQCGMVDERMGKKHPWQLFHINFNNPMLVNRRCK